MTPSPSKPATTLGAPDSPASPPIDPMSPEPADEGSFELAPDVLAKVFGDNLAPGAVATVTLRLGDNNQVTVEPEAPEMEEEPEIDNGVPPSIKGSPKAGKRLPSKDLPPVKMDTFDN